MKSKQFTPLALIFVIAIALILFYKPLVTYKTISGDIQGTTYNITYQDRPSRNLQPRIDHLLKKFDNSLSTYDSNSIISRINNNDPSVKPDRYFKTVFNKAEEVYHLTDGAFDITVGPIVNAWGFGPGPKSDTDSAKIDSIMTFVGMDKIALLGGKLNKKHPNIRLDVNAIAQGFSADIVGEFLENKGITNYLVEIGGEIVAKGVSKSNQAWKIGVDKPFDNNFSPGKNLQSIIQISDKGLATSGNYRKFFEKDGVKYVHSINPKTGYPIKNRLLSATVVAEDCMTADAFATAFMVMGVEKSIIFLSNHEDLDALLVYSDKEGDFKTFITPRLKESIIQPAE